MSNERENIDYLTVKTGESEQLTPEHALILAHDELEKGGVKAERAIVIFIYDEDAGDNIISHYKWYLSNLDRGNFMFALEEL